MTGFARRDIVTSADGNAKKSRGVVQRVLELTGQDWADRGYCWMTHYDCARGRQPCLRSRPDGPGTWVIVMWDGYPGPYAEPAGNLVMMAVQERN